MYVDIPEFNPVNPARQRMSLQKFSRQVKLIWSMKILNRFNISIATKSGRAGLWRCCNGAHLTQE